LNRFKVIAYLDIAINIDGRITINNVKAAHKAIIIIYVKGNFKEVLLDKLSSFFVKNICLTMFI
ncbi:MAG: hypothetical protein ACYDIA_07120, partial [Candidatus Humimicrobiaceae bacterium]